MKRVCIRDGTGKKEVFVPQAVTEVTEQADSEEMNEYVLKPLYTQKEIREFRKQNEQDGNFIVTKDTVKSMEDLEKAVSCLAGCYGSCGRNGRD